MNLFTSFKQANPQDHFFNTSRNEDMSTIYHGEYEGGDPSMDYWGYPPTASVGDYDMLLAYFGENYGLLVGVNAGNNTYVPLLDKGVSPDPYLLQLGVVYGVAISEATLLRLVEDVRIG